MQELYGLFDKEIFRDEKTGFTGFFITCENDVKVFCSGKIQKIINKVPLKLEGTYVTDAKKRTKFNFSRYEFKSNTDSDEIVFLLSLKIDKLGLKEATEFVDFFKDGIFDAVNDCKNKNNFIKRCPTNLQFLAGTVFTKVNRTNKLKDLFFEVIKAGGDYTNVSLLLEKYGDTASKQLNKDPYLSGYYANFSFKTCDNLAYKKGFERLSPERANGLLYFAMDMVSKKGDSFANRKEFEGLCNILQNKSILGQTDFLYIWAKAILDNNFIVEKNNICWASVRKQEELLVEDIKRLIQSGKTLNVTDAEITRIETLCKVNLSQSQKAAMWALNSSGVKVITGGPGSGKTTLTNTIIRYCEENYPERGIVLCAPTGCASQNMAEKTKHVAETIHRTLGLKPYGNKEQKQNRVTKKRDEKIYIIDESSMMDLELAVVLFDSIPNDSIVLLVGDIDQLPSVGVGNVLCDLIDAGIETYKLEGSFRQKAGSLIIDNSKKIKEGDISLNTSSDFNIWTAETEIDAIDMCLRFTDLDKDIQVLTPTKKFLSGSRQLSEQIQIQRMKSLKKMPTLLKKYSGINYYVGDKIIMTDNNYQCGYFNGEPGEIIDIDAEGIEVKFSETKTLYIENSHLGDMTLAYALTIHKSQGAEYPSVIVLLTSKAINMMNRNLLYTAITRAKQTVTIITIKGTLSYAIESIQKRRNSNLVELLRF